MRNSANVSLIGNLVKDPELRQAGNQTVCNFRVGVNANNPDRNSETKFINNYYSCTLWGSRGEFFANAAKKGMLVHVCGELVETTYNRQDGTVATDLRINCNSADLETREFVQTNAPAQGRQNQRAQQGQYAPSQRTMPTQASVYQGEDLPF